MNIKNFLNLQTITEKVRTGMSHKLRSLGLVVCLVLGLFLLTSCGGGGKTSHTNTENKDADHTIPQIRSTGKPLASLSAKVLGTDKELSFRPDSKQHLTIVTLWSPAWFDKSVAQIEALKQLRQKYQAPQLRIICLVYDTQQDKAKKIIKEQAINFEMGLGDSVLYNKLQVKAIPTYWFLDSDGNTLEVVEGLMDYDTLVKRIGLFIREAQDSDKKTD